jgi:hypothetical protein
MGIIFNDSRGQDSHRAPCLIVDNLRKDNQVFPRFFTKNDILLFSPQLGSQDCTPELFNHIILSFHGFSCNEFQFCYLRTRFVSQGVVCLHSVGLVGSWTFTVITFNDPRGSTFFVSLYISLYKDDKDDPVQ